MIPRCYWITDERISMEIYKNYIFFRFIRGGGFNNRADVNSLGGAIQWSPRLGGGNRSSCGGTSTWRSWSARIPRRRRSTSLRPCGALATPASTPPTAPPSTTSSASPPTPTSTQYSLHSLSLSLLSLFLYLSLFLTLCGCVRMLVFLAHHVFDVLPESATRFLCNIFLHLCISCAKVFLVSLKIDDIWAVYWAYYIV